MINYQSDDVNPLTIELCKTALEAKKLGYVNAVKLISLAMELIENPSDKQESNVIAFHKFKYEEYDNKNDNYKDDNKPFVA